MHACTAWGMPAQPKVCSLKAGPPSTIPHPRLTPDTADTWGAHTMSAGWPSKLEAVPAMKARRVATSLMCGRTAGSWDQQSLQGGGSARACQDREGSGQEAAGGQRTKGQGASKPPAGVAGLPG